MNGLVALVGVELTRLRLRRAVLVLLAVAVVVPALLWASTAWDTRAPSDADARFAEEQMATDTADCLAWAEEEERRLDAESDGSVGNVVICASPDGTGAEDYLTRPPLDLEEERTDSGFAVVVLLGVVVLLVGTTFAGADWASGSMSVQLLVEPRRTRVWVAKAVAVGLWAAVVALVVQVAYWSALVALASWRMRPWPEGFTGELVETVAAATLLLTVAAVTTYALTMLLRSTVGALGVLFAVLVLGSLLVGLLPFDAPERWLVPTNVLAFVTGEYRYYLQTPECLSGSGLPGCEGVIDRSESGLFLLVGAAVVVTASVLSFRRRDVP